MDVGAERAALARVFLQGCLEAVTRSARVEGVTVVSTTSALETTVLPTGARFRVQGESGGINAAILESQRELDPGSDSELAVLVGDLPALTTVDLDHALLLSERSSNSRAMVPDFHGRGTTLLTTRGGVPMEPRFEGSSRWAHETSGFQVLPVPGTSTLRMDVDSVDDLVRAARVGVGRHTYRRLPDSVRRVIRGPV